MLQCTATNELSKVQRLACLGITGAMKSTPSTNCGYGGPSEPPPLHMVVMGEGRMGYFRLQDKPTGIYTRLRHNQIGRHVGVDIGDMGTDYMTPKENNLRAYRNKRINILTDSQAALKGLRNHKVTSRLLWECWKELSDLARHNRVVLLWVPRHSGIKGNEKADELARKGSSASYIGPEPTMVRSQVKEWVNAQHKEYWNNITRHQHGKIFIREPSAKLTREQNC
ncbi:hypothetical protein NQ315_000113 [Exocentrus adspersus]|uniref:RNase H type-1 domain-containing protein n=1 Tax=Exocentrus adspersus TaxID=1586481 RepID=A0AAV8VU08_9CUCU|nr:hypothetical protein NQ315_000113 [Exocentrus adspersus]